MAKKKKVIIEEIEPEVNVKVTYENVEYAPITDEVNETISDELMDEMMNVGAELVSDGINDDILTGLSLIGDEITEKPITVAKPRSVDSLSLSEYRMWQRSGVLPN